MRIWTLLSIGVDLRTGDPIQRVATDGEYLICPHGLKNAFLVDKGAIATIEVIARVAIVIAGDVLNCYRHQYLRNAGQHTLNIYQIH